MRRITSDLGEALSCIAAARAAEQAAAAALPAHTLMRRAGMAVARLAMALAPAAQTHWLACGPGNNGGDGLEAAMQLQHRGKEAWVTWLGDEDSAPPDARDALARARGAGVHFCDAAPPTAQLCIDALLGIGAARAPQGRLAELIEQVNASPAPTLSVDLPSGLSADTGTSFGPLLVKARWTLSLLSLKPGFFTAQGRDCSGEVWFDDLGVSGSESNAWLLGADRVRLPARLHASHKGSYGDVAVVGGAPGMTGGALLAARGALHSGAGRVLVALLDAAAMTVDPQQPELMFRRLESLDLKTLTLVCGCGGGQAVHAVLPAVLSTAARLVLDADALNAVAQDSALQTLLRARAPRGLATLLTPHPLEAARLLGQSAAQVQADRLAAARALAARFDCAVVLKGSGSVIAAPGQVTAINPTGNARLASAGTGDVLAGMAGARLAGGLTAFEAGCHAAFVHGRLADNWPPGQSFTADLLARAACPDLPL